MTPATWRALLLLCVVAASAGCGRDTPSAATSPAAANAGPGVGVTNDGTCEAGCAARATPPPPVCAGTVDEYCASLGGECPTYEESVDRLASLCTHWVVTTRACGHRYQSIRWREPVLGGGEEYFDSGGRLIAAYRYTDYNAYCDGRSFAKTFGRVPTCATGLLERNLCLRPPAR